MLPVTASASDSVSRVIDACIL